MNTTLNVKYLIRRDTEENWINKNPILLSGETGLITSGEHTGMSKTGDGITSWSNLSFDKAIANGGNSDTVAGHAVEVDIPVKLGTIIQQSDNIVFKSNNPETLPPDSMTPDSAPIIETLKDKDGNTIQPRTLTRAIYGENGKRLDTELSKVARISNITPTGILPVDADTLNKKDYSYYQNISGTYNARCIYVGDTKSYNITLNDNTISISENFFTLRFIAPNNYVNSSTISFNSVVYTPISPNFILGQVVLANFDLDSKKCYFLSGELPIKNASGISINNIVGLAGSNVQTSLENLQLNKQPIGDYATNTALTTGLNTKQPVGSYATKTELTDGLATKQPSGDYATNTALNLKAPLNSPTFTGTVSGISKSMVGLSSVDNTSDLNKPISTATQNALNLKSPLDSPTFTGTVSGITKAMVGLDSVDNTSDLSKPVSTAMQSALNLKANLASPTFNGTPYSTTPSTGDNSTRIATTAFVNNEINSDRPYSTAVPIVNGSATSGVSTYLSRADHVHPTDTSRAPLNSPNFTGTPTCGNTPSASTNNNQIATTAFVNIARPYSTISPLMNGAANQGSSINVSRHDHVHPTDTTRAPINSPAFTGNVSVAGNIRVKGSGNYGNKLNFGDSEYVYLYEYLDDKLKIHANEINLEGSTIASVITIGKMKIIWNDTDKSLDFEVIP